MADRDRNPPTKVQKGALRALGFPDELMPAVRSAEDAEAILHNFRTPEAMRRFISGGNKSNAGERFLAAFESDTTPPSKPEVTAEPARDDQDRESPDEAPVIGAESFVPEPHVCIHCKLDPPDGTERTLDDGVWIHPRCESAYIAARMTEEGLAQEGASSPQTPPPLPQTPPPPPSDKPNASPLVPDRTEAARFLALLDRTATRFTFQTFDDDKERRSKALARVLHGSLDEHFAELARLNNAGAGIFVTVNETNLRGRLATDVIKVRLLFGDFDNGVPLPQDGPRRYMAIQSSAIGRHGYWKPNGIALDAFTPTQELIAKRFNGDSKVKDLPRVMRLPGFWHRKGEPFMSRIIEVHEDAPVCSAADFETDKIKYQAKARQEEANFEGLGGPWSVLNMLALKHLDKWVPALFGDAAVYQPGTSAYRVSSKALGRDLQEDLSIHPKGIKDWGVADQGDAHQGGRTPIDLVMEYRNVDADAAFDWLDVQLRDVEKPQQSKTEDKPWRRAPIHEWVGKPVPKPEYTVEDRILAEQVFLFSGEGGSGKSSMIEHLCAAHVLGREWLRCTTKQGPAIYIECEDTERVLWWRLAAVAVYYGVSIETFAADLHLYSLVEHDTILAATDKRGIVQPTRAFDRLYEMAGDIKPVQIGIASAANIFAGSEITRTEVQQFLKLLNRIPEEVLVNEPFHPSRKSKGVTHYRLALKEAATT